MSKLKSSQNRKGKENKVKYKRRPDAYKVNVLLDITDEKFVLNDIHNDMTVAQLKDEVEVATGIPVSLQRLCYLDEGELQDQTDIRSNDFVPNCTLKLKVWPMYRELVEAVVANDIDWVFRLGVTESSDYHTPTSDYMSKKSRKLWLEERAFIALCIAAHRGYEEMTVKLIENGAKVNMTTPTGKTPLHLAAAKSNGEIINVLLHSGVDVHTEDKNGNTALMIAERFGSKVCARNLFQFQWQQRAKKSKPSPQVPLFAHQYHDSSFPVWKRGKSAQIYVSTILKPGEYEGTALSAPRSGRHPSLIHKQIRDATFFSDSQDSGLDHGTEEVGNLPIINKDKKKQNLKKPLSYEQWIGKQKEIERKKILEKKIKEEEEAKRKQEEEEKKKEEIEKLSYEQWLFDREQEKLEKSPRLLSKSQSFAQDTFSSLPVHQDGAFRVYLRSLGKSRTGVNYEDWLNEKEREINELVKKLHTNG
ncbi:ankyrin repeat, bromo and BTB domain-containing protein [Biomphalaria glabrata]|uniref:Ubiquitin-like domain-containing protein n=1 Tax=Biomphalaria glabrata TaxID=6526 RepID=A0A2C9L6A0_BIOGL|nr:ankyrin repeat, bromo and BTB domain-containing protein [Biomphalaria glabrata]